MSPNQEYQEISLRRQARNRAIRSRNNSSFVTDFAPTAWLIYVNIFGKSTVLKLQYGLLKLQFKALFGRSAY